MGNSHDFSLEENEQCDNSSNTEHVDNREGEYIGESHHNTLLMTIFYWNEWIKRNSIYLSTEKCCEISEQCRVEKRPSDSIEIAKTISYILLSFPEKYDQEAKYSSKKWKMIILGDEKKLRKLKNIPIKEVSQNELLISPLRKEVPYASKEEDWEGEEYEGSVRKYRTWKAFFPWKMVEKSHKEKPGNRYENTESPDFESKELERGIHED